MHSISRIGEKFIQNMLGDGYDISPKERPSDKLAKSCINKVNQHVVELRSALRKNLEDIKGIHHDGKISENDALLALPFEGKPEEIVSKFTSELKNMRPEAQDITYRYLEALDKGVQTRTPESIKKSVTSFLKEHEVSKTDEGQKNDRLRPYETEKQIPITERLLTHGATALLLFEGRKIAKPNISKPIEKHFKEAKRNVADRLGKENGIFSSQDEYWDLANKEREESKNKKSFVEMPHAGIPKRRGAFTETVQAQKSGEKCLN